jgi:hypothetical protein
MLSGNDPPPVRRRSGTIWAIIIGAALVLMVVLHLTGVVGAGAH